MFSFSLSENIDDNSSEVLCKMHVGSDSAQVDTNDNETYCQKTESDLKK